MAFELGSALRDAREARQLAFEEVAAATRIQPRFLAALEGERFETLPGRAYARSFLHEYAHYLGLDATPFVSEYDLRYCDTRIAPRPLVAVQRHDSHRIRRALIATAAACLLAVGVLAWRFGDTNTPPVEAAVAAKPVAAAAAAQPTAQPRSAPATTPARELTVSARGRCWISVRAGSQTGRVLYEGILDSGTSMRFTERPLWIRFGAPWNVDVRLDGHAVALPSGRTPANLRFTATAQPA
ncbi:MAG: helix-turn-helix domain-containing protein [Gaiellaceae bacterium]